MERIVKGHVMGMMLKFCKVMVVPCRVYGSDWARVQSKGQIGNKAVREKFGI